MSGSTKFLLGALLVVETTWWYTLAALVGVLIGLGGSPLNGFSVLLVLAASAGLSVALQAPRIDILVAQGTAMVIALGVIYLAIAFSVGSLGGSAFQPLWLLDTLSGGASYHVLGQQILGAALGIALWWRGMDIGATASIDTLLLRSFKIGLIVITVGAVIDALAPLSFGMLWVAFAFFLAGLSALMLNQLQREGDGGGLEGRWLQIAIGTVGAVIVTGIVLSLAAGGAPAAVAGWVFGTVGAIVSWVLIIIATPLAYAMEYVVGGLQWLIERLVGEQESAARPFAGALNFLEELRERAGDRDVPALLSIIFTVLKWAFIIYCGLAILLLLYLAFMRRSGSKEGQAVRTSTWGETPLWQDLAMLLRKLFPQPRVQSAGAPLPVPQGEDPRSALLRLYYNALLYAQQRGVARRPSQTPLEYHRSTLRRVFPQEISRRLTEAFNRVRYGLWTPQEEEVQEMEQEVIHAVEGAPEPGSGGSR